MATINYKTKEKPAVQRRVLEALKWIGVRQTSYSEISKSATCSSSDCRYAIMDLEEKGYVERIKTAGYANATRGNRYAYKVTEAGEKWLEVAVVESEPEPEPEDPHGLFV